MGRKPTGTRLIDYTLPGDRLYLPPLNAAEDRVMLCGSPGLLVDLKHILEARGFKEGKSRARAASRWFHRKTHQQAHIRSLAVAPVLPRIESTGIRLP